LGEDGVSRCGIEVVRGGIVSRGVLLDIPRLVGRPYLEIGEAITEEDLERAEAVQGVHVEPGDVLLVRTGRAIREQTEGEVSLYPDNAAGLHLSTLPWLRDRRAAVLGGDGTSDRWPTPVPEVYSPIHVGTLVMLGIHLLDNAALEEVADACAARQRWEFLFALGPIVIEGGTGSLVNPMAVF
jgi:kynurenine formamidase